MWTIYVEFLGMGFFPMIGFTKKKDAVEYAKRNRTYPGEFDIRKEKLYESVDEVENVNG